MIPRDTLFVCFIPKVGLRSAFFDQVEAQCKCLLIRLWRKVGEEHIDLEASAELPEDFRIKLPAIIGDDRIRDTESATNVSPYEVFHPGCRYSR
ncbi:unnamed protein product [Prunus brigantina]